VPEPTTAPTLPFKPKSDKIEVAMGKAGPLAPAADGGDKAAAEINDFGFDLLRRLDPAGNLCVSPTSIALALAMTRAGAEGQTATEMDKVLRSFGSDGQASEIVALLAALKADNYTEEGEDENGNDVQVQKARLDLANATFTQQRLPVEQAFLDALSSRFSSGMYLVDYQKDAEAARKVINDWVYDHTQGRIPQILSPGDVDPSTLIALVNAMYLQAHWAKEFDPASTKSLPFTRSDGSRVSVPTMASEDDWGYASGKGWRAVDLPYAGYTMSMTIIVPDDMASFVAGLNAASLATIWKSEKKYDVTLTLPRFKADSHFDLASHLAAMGMPTAFDPNTADFSGITGDRSIYIGKVIHQANIDVDETGTTAAAATVVVGKGMIGEPDPIPSVTFHVNQPFLFLIHDKATGAVLFAGRIDDPSATS
jgi:serpin B